MSGGRGGKCVPHVPKTTVQLLGRLSHVTSLMCIFAPLQRFSEVKMIPSVFTALAAEERDGPSENGASHEGATTRLIKQVCVTTHEVCTHS